MRGLSQEQLDTPYRAGGWTVRQVVHHLPDSHLNAYVRFKLALTEDKPTICPYDEARWAELGDSRHTPIATSLELLERLHERWVVLLRSMAPADFARRFVHPELGELDLNLYTAQYGWHGRHHVAQITALRAAVGLVRCVPSAANAAPLLSSCLLLPMPARFSRNSVLLPYWACPAGREAAWRSCRRRPGLRLLLRKSCDCR